MGNYSFICAACGNVSDEKCAWCNVENPRSANVATIKRHLEACNNAAQVTACMENYRPHIQRLHRHGGAAKTMAIQIENLAKHIAKVVKPGWNAGAGSPQGRKIAPHNAGRRVL